MMKPGVQVLVYLALSLSYTIRSTDPPLKGANCEDRNKRVRKNKKKTMEHVSKDRTSWNIFIVCHALLCQTDNGLQFFQV